MLMCHCGFGALLCWAKFFCAPSLRNPANPWMQLFDEGLLGCRDEYQAVYDQTCDHFLRTGSCSTRFLSEFLTDRRAKRIKRAVWDGVALRAQIQADLNARVSDFEAQAETAQSAGPRASQQAQQYELSACFDHADAPTEASADALCPADASNEACSFDMAQASWDSAALGNDENTDSVSSSHAQSPAHFALDAAPPTTPAPVPSTLTAALQDFPRSLIAHLSPSRDRFWLDRGPIDPDVDGSGTIDTTPARPVERKQPQSAAAVAEQKLGELAAVEDPPGVASSSCRSSNVAFTSPFPQSWTREGGLIPCRTDSLTASEVR